MQRSNRTKIRPYTPGLLCTLTVSDISLEERIVELRGVTAAHLIRYQRNQHNAHRLKHRQRGKKTITSAIIFTGKTTFSAPHNTRIFQSLLDAMHRNGVLHAHSAVGYHVPPCKRRWLCRPSWCCSSIGTGTSTSPPSSWRARTFFRR